MFDDEYKAECPFCKSTMQPVEKLTEGIYKYRCDKLHINQEISVILSVDFIKKFLKPGKAELTDREIGIMLYLILKFKGNVVFNIAKSGEENIEKTTYQFMKYEQLIAMYPESYANRIKMILENLSHVYLNRVDKILIDKRQLSLTANANKYIFLPDGSNQSNIQQEMLNTLEEKRYISKIDGNGDVLEYHLTEKAIDDIGLVYK